MDPVLVDSRGNPLFPAGTGREAYSGLSTSVYRKNAPRMARDRKDMLNSMSMREMIAESRFIISKHDPLRGALNQKKDYVCRSGFIPQFQGTDREWGKRAERALKLHLPRCNIRGSAYNFGAAQRIQCRALDEDGSFFKLWIRDPQTGLPLTQNIEAHRVGSLPGQKIVDARIHPNARRFDGAKIVNGIIFGDYGEELAIQIVSNAYAPEVVDIVPAGSYQHGVDPEFFTQARAIPPVAYAVFSFADQYEIRGAQRIKQKLSSKLVFTADTTTGGLRQVSALQGQPPQTTGPDQLVEMNDGEVWSFKAGTGQGVKPFVMDTPGNGFIIFDTLIERACFYAIGWRREMLDLAGLNSAGVHGFADMINATILSRWQLLASFALQEIQWYVAGLIDTGKLPANPEWMDWAFTPPPMFSANPSRTQSGDHEALRMGTTTHVELIRKRGRDPEESLREQAAYIRMRNEIAAENGISPSDLGRTDKPGDAQIEDTPTEDPAPALPKSTDSEKED